MKKFLKFLLKLLIIICILLAGLFLFAKYKTSQGNNSFNVVIIGIDSREGVEGARADSVMIAHVNSDHSQVTLTSIPRDTYAYIPKVNRYEKLTHAYSYGQSEEVLATLSNLFDYKFDKYVEVDFQKVISLVDSVNGITLKSSHTFCEMDEHDKKNQYCFEEGKTYNMNGKEALSYARHRKSDSDIYRAKRQQEVISALIKKAKSLGPLVMTPVALNAYREVNTNISFLDFPSFFDMITMDFKINRQVADGYSAYKYDSYYNQNLSYFFINPVFVQEFHNELVNSN